MATELTGKEYLEVLNARNEQKYRAVRNAILAIKAEYPEGMKEDQIDPIINLLRADLVGMLRNDWSHMNECFSFRNS